MSLGLFIGSLVVLAIGLITAGLGFYIGHTAVEKQDALNCGNKLSYIINKKVCDDQTTDYGIGLGLFIGSGIFIILGLITSIIFGVKLVLVRRKKKVEIEMKDKKHAIPVILYGAFLAIFGAIIAIVAFTNSIATMLNFGIGLFMTSAGIVILIVSYREYVHINLDLEDQKRVSE